MKKEIKKANLKSEFAVQVTERRESDAQFKDYFADANERFRQNLQTNNYTRKN